MKYLTLVIILVFSAQMAFAQCISGDCNNGKGTYVYGDDTKYIGSFKDGKAHGEGICYYSSGDKYVGEWANHAFNGQGTLTKKDGNIFKGIWQRGKLVIADKDNKVKANIKKQEAVTSESDKAIKVEKPKVYAVIVGVARYLHMQSLNYTDDDAYRMYAFLKSPQGGALPDSQVVILIDESATRGKVIKAMDKVFQKANENDMILFYFSGHGEKEGLLPIDYNGYDNVLEHKTIKKKLNQSKAKYKLCITDACYAGTMEETLNEKAKKTESQRISDLYKQLDKNVSLALFMSSQAQETSVENAGLRQGIFSHFLLRALKGEADKNKDKMVTLAEVYKFVQGNVKFYTSQYQTPVLVGDNVKEDLVLSVIE